jgi:hypothetical protein
MTETQWSDLVKTNWAKSSRKVKAKRASRPIDKYRVTVYAQVVEVFAYTKSEARAIAKRQLGYRKRERLPVNTTVEKFNRS